MALVMKAAVLAQPEVLIRGDVVLLPTAKLRNVSSATKGKVASTPGYASAPSGRRCPLTLISWRIFTKLLASPCRVRVR